MSLSLLRQRQFFLGPLLSGILIGTSYIPFPPWSALFCFVPLWIFWSRATSLRAVFLAGLFCAFVFTLIGFNWVAYTLHEFAHLDWIVSILGLLLFALLSHLFVPLAGSFWYLVSRWRGLTGWRSEALMMLMVILAQAWVPMLFDWNFGYSWLWVEMPISQVAEWVGFDGLSALTLMFNFLIWQVAKSATRSQLTAGLALILAAFLGLNLLGSALRQRLPPTDAVLRVLMVQGNIGNSEKIAAELGQGYPDGILKTYLDLSQTALDLDQEKPVDFMLWPETAYPDFLGEGFRPSERRERLISFLRARQIALVTGAYGFDRTSGRLTNSVFVLDQAGHWIPPNYSKTKLLAFGEYLPGEEWFPFLRDWLPPIGMFQRGEGPKALLSLGSMRMGAQICYESLFPEYSRAWSDLGAMVFINVTNDSWYGTWAEPWQHLIMTVARGVEFRRPVLRATNTGFSTVGLPDGRRMEISPLHEPWAKVLEVPFQREPQATLYQRHPWMIPAVTWMFLAGVVAVPVKRSQRKGDHVLG